MAQLLDRVADGVWLVTGTEVNWVMVTDADEVTWSTPEARAT